MPWLFFVVAVLVDHIKLQFTLSNVGTLEYGTGDREDRRDTSMLSRYDYLETFLSRTKVAK
jgi:hypothetical protein